MELLLCHTEDDENVIGKVFTVTEPIGIRLKSDVDVVSPVIRLKMDYVENLYNSNYAEIKEFGRYYFIRSIININKNVWEVRLECDVMESHKDDILNSDVRISRGVESGDYQNTQLESQVIKDIDIYESDVTLENTDKYILSVIAEV